MKLAARLRLARALLQRRQPGYAIAFVTGRCDLRCKVCCPAATASRGEPELTPAEWGAALAGARGVIASAGFSLLSECMCLRKKMLLLPLAGQYEQVINAHYAQKLGLGLQAETLDETIVTQFLDVSTNLCRTTTESSGRTMINSSRFFGIS